MDETAIDRGVAVVAALAPAEPSIADVVDVLEAVVDSPDEIRTVLQRAEAAGHIERSAGTVVQAQSLQSPDRRAGIVRREGDYSCRRCGRGVSTGHFLRVNESEIGPYGSTCIRRITGRE